MAEFPGLSYLNVAKCILQPGSKMYLLEHEPAQISPERENKRHLFAVQTRATWSADVAVAQDLRAKR
jgi:hypothetical protein